MGKKIIPSASEVREYLEKEDAARKACIKNGESYVITGSKFPGENIWRSKITLPLLEAAENVGASKEEIWELCRKIAQTTHAPVTKKEYLRMSPFAQKEKTVDAVLKLLDTYIPPFERDYWLDFDIAGYYYCIALISLSDYRKEDCEKQLRETTKQFIERDTESKRIPVLMRNMKVLEPIRPSLKAYRECIERKMKNTLVEE